MTATTVQRSSAYADKLKDPRWQRLRLQVFERDQWGCVYCRRKDRTLHAHHLWYDRGRQPWEYPPWRIVTVCDVCHDREHSDRAASEQFLCRSLSFAGASAGAVTFLGNAFRLIGLLHIEDSQAAAKTSSAVVLEAAKMALTIVLGREPEGKEIVAAVTGDMSLAGAARERLETLERIASGG